MSKGLRSMQDMFNGTPVDLSLSPTPLQLECERLCAMNEQLRTALEAARDALTKAANTFWKLDDADIHAQEAEQALDQINKILGGE